MSALLRFPPKTLVSNVLSIRTLTTTLVNRIKEIQQRQENNSLIIEGVTKVSPRADNMLKSACVEKFCPECTLGLDIKHTDVLILSQYVRSDGCMLPKRITGLCHRQQKKIGTLVTMAQKAGLMPNLAPANSKRDPTKRYGWKKFNKYFNEKTIKY
ncbi:mitochondrial ribosomal protein S18A [Haematobia irritans]|uniref:Large ribosomal subunit protein mL66 n=1 Tax=Haematobia irritans TaxID=7368 RepID=A0A1L8ECP1_HAEIR